MSAKEGRKMNKNELILIADACFDAIGAVEQAGNYDTALCLRWAGHRIMDEVSGPNRHLPGSVPTYGDLVTGRAEADYVAELRASE
jgi:hypothetical protein